MYIQYTVPGFEPMTLFSIYFWSFQTNIIYNKYMWTNVHPVYSAGIRTHDLWNVSLFP